MEYKWNNPPIAKTSFEIYKCLAKERHFSRETMKNFINNNIEYHDASLFKSSKAICDKINKAIKDNKKIAVFADYDCDGVCSCYILYMALKYINADVIYKLPNRMKDGYGIKEKSVLELNDLGVDLIITTDNGIAAVDAVDKALELGMDIIITDHHLPKDKLPNCLIMDAHVKDSGYPFNGLCGAGVAFKLASLLIKDFKNCYIYSELVTAAAIATIADQMLLIDENRKIVKEGLMNINSPLCSIGILKLIELFGLNRYKVNSGNIGFAIAPCINAAGRLDTPEYALKLLLSDCDSDAKYYGEKIFNLNEKRKEIQKNISDNLIVDDNTECIMIAMKENITGIAGILASRIKEKYLKPTFIFHDDGENLGGSARTFGEFPIIDCLNGNKDLILEGGGHAAACGVKLKKENLKKFNDRCDEIFKKWKQENPDKLLQELKATCKIDFTLINDKLVNNINKLEPFGNGNEEPIFICENIEVVESKIIGKLKNTVKLKLKNNNVELDAIGFQSFKEKYCEAYSPKNINLMFNIKLNEFPKGTFKIQLNCIDFKIR